jgi:Uma2 family endonuclease
MATSPASTAQISLEDYLRTSYQPDRDYLDGEIEERYVGEYDHTIVQRAVLLWFYAHEKQWGIRSLQEQRTLLNPTTIRIPDVSVFSREVPVEQVFTQPQLIAVEVLSPEDRATRIQERIDDYIAFGIANVWVINPKSRIGWDCSDGSWIRQERFEVPGTPMYLSLAELFQKIDDEA